MPLLAAALLAALAGPAPRLEVNDGLPLYSVGPRVRVAGRVALPATVTVTLEGRAETAVAGTDGRWQLDWPEPLAPGLYALEVVAADAGGTVLATVAVDLLVHGESRLPRRPLVTPPVDVALPERPEPEVDDFVDRTDRWRLPVAGSTLGKRKLDPYNQNKWKGDVPIRGDALFLVLTATSDTLIDGHRVPTPSSVSADRPGSIDFFGEGDQLRSQQNLSLSADLYRGSTAFKPVDWRLKATAVLNGNHLEVRETAAVSPDVRRGTDRTDGRLALQELFYERKLRDLSAAYDFLSLRVGVQPFSSDFRGFVFTDTNLGVRLFGNARANRWQYNVAFFERLEKDTNSGLNTFELRDQRLAVANVYRQDTMVKGYTAQASVHWLRDDATFLLDRNGFLARPDPVGSAEPHRIEALYLGWTGFGHLGRLNIDHALYFVTGEDSLNPIAGRDLFGSGRDDVDIGAWMAAIELSMDRDWLRPRLSIFYASGDDDPTDRDARGFAAIFESPAFAGGGFSFWNRLGIRLAGTGVSLINRGSLVPDLRSSKEEGQPNFVNPGVAILSLGLDAELTPKLRASGTASYLRFDTTEVLELLTFQAPIDEEIGFDLSLGLRYRPFLNNNAVLVGGVAALLPGRGFGAIYEDRGALFAAFTGLTLVF